MERGRERENLKQAPRLRWGSIPDLSQNQELDAQTTELPKHPKSIFNVSVLFIVIQFIEIRIFKALTKLQDEGPYLHLCPTAETYLDWSVMVCDGV